MNKKIGLKIVLLTILVICGCNLKKVDIVEGYKKVNGVNHFYKIVGKGEAFVLLHGGPGSFHDELYPFFLDFAKSHKVIFYDQRGNGKSTLSIIDSTTFNEELMVEDLEELRKKFGIEKLNIIGHSWGGLLAMYYAVKYPNNLNRLILVDAAPVNTELLIKSYENLVSMYDPTEWDYVQKLWNSNEYLAGDPDVHNEALRIGEGTVIANKDVINDFMEAASFNNTTAKNAVALSSLVTKIKLRIHVQDKLSNIQCPTLIINGKEDFIVEEAPLLAQQLIPNSELVFIAGAGHYPHIENSESFFNELNDFIIKTAPNNE
jgi:proline iminopeptidase